jgi:hypothetical protein
MYLETDINKEPRLIIVDENDVEWCISESTSSAPSGAAFVTEIVQKDKCFFFRSPPSDGGI